MIPTEALLPVSMHDQVKQTVLLRLNNGMNYWRPLHARQDYWYMMYLLQDVIQQMKPVGQRRFISNEAHTAVDLAQSILTRNPAFWRIALFETTNENAEERRLIGKIERTLQGIIYDIDEMFSQRLRMRFWKQAAYQSLIRGYIWAKVQITTDALKYRDTPIMAEMYDPRMVYPHVDSLGLNHVIIQSMTTLGDLVSMYPDKFGDKEKEKNYNPQAPAVKVEYWSNDRGDNKGICCVMASETVTSNYASFWDANGGNNNPAMNPRFVIDPYFHGYSPAALPVVGVPVNGLDLMVKPQLGELLTDRLAERANILRTPTSYSWWTGANSYVAETGRSILAAVEEHVPQYNELVATVMQHLALNTWPTLVFKTPSGELPKFQDGINARIPLRPEETVDRLPTQALNPEAFKLIEILGSEKQNGMLSNILRANTTTPFDGTGVLFQQMAHAALNALEPFQDGMEEFGQRVGTSLLAQMQMAAPILKSFSVLAPPQTSGVKSRQSFMVIDFDPKKDLDKKKRYRPRPVFKPALPDDLALRINSAKLALDPRRPILSLTTVLEHILEVEDPTDEIDRIWEDIANTDPVIVLEQIGAALERLGETELAQRIQEKQFQQNFQNELQTRQATGNLPPAPGAPGNMPPQAGANSFSTATDEDQGLSSGIAPPPGLPNGDQTGVG